MSKDVKLSIYSDSKKTFDNPCFEKMSVRRLTELQRGFARPYRILPSC